MLLPDVLVLLIPPLVLTVPPLELLPPEVVVLLTPPLLLTVPPLELELELDVELELELLLPPLLPPDMRPGAACVRVPSPSPDCPYEDDTPESADLPPEPPEPPEAASDAAYAVPAVPPSKAPSSRTEVTTRMFSPVVVVAEEHGRTACSANRRPIRTQHRRRCEIARSNDSGAAPVPLVCSVHDFECAGSPHRHRYAACPPPCP